MSAQLPIPAAVTPRFRTSLPLITSSSVKKYRACQRLYRYELVDLVRPLHRAAALAYGTLGHRGLEAWWIAAMREPSTPDAWFHAAIDAVRAGEEDPFQLARTEAMMAGYHARWQDMHWGGEALEVLGVEVEFRAPLINPETGAESRTWQRGGKIDALVRGKTSSKVWLVEHKTTTENFEPGAEYWRRLILDPQISHYHVGARALGYEVAGCIYDVLRKPGQEPHKAVPPEKVRWTKGTEKEPSRPYAGQRLEDETPDEYYDRIVADIAADPRKYYARAEVVRLAEEEQASAANDWQTALMIRASERLNLWPQNPSACYNYGRLCSYYGVCSRVESLDDPTRFRRAERPHEELSVPDDAVIASDAADAAE